MGGEHLVRKIYLSCLSCLVGFMGLRYYFGLTSLNGPFFKGYGLVCLIIAVLLLSCYFKDLPQKLVRRLTIINLIALFGVQLIPLSTFVFTFEWNVELILPTLIVLFEVMGFFYRALTSLIGYISLKRARLKVN